MILPLGGKVINESVFLSKSLLIVVVCHVGTKKQGVSFNQQV